jgi:hypothetical protein
MAMEVIRTFKRDEFKDAKAVAEVVYLVPVLNKDAFQDLLRELYTGISSSGLLNVHQLEGLSQLIQGAGPGNLDADDLVKILDLLSKRLRGVHCQSREHAYQLTMAVSHILDAMTDVNVKDLDRKRAPLVISERASSTYGKHTGARLVSSLSTSICLPLTSLNETWSPSSYGNPDSQSLRSES